MITDFFDIDTSPCQIKKHQRLKGNSLLHSSLYHPENLKEVSNGGIQEINHRSQFNTSKRMLSTGDPCHESETDLRPGKFNLKRNCHGLQVNSFSLFDDTREQLDNSDVADYPLQGNLTLSLEDSAEEPDSGSNANGKTLLRPVSGAEDEFFVLKAEIKKNFLHKLPELIEYRDKGFNTAGIDKLAVAELQERVRMALLSAQQPASALCDAAREFLTTLKPLSSQLHKGDAIQLANLLIRNTADALGALDAVSKTGSLSWSQEASRTAREQSEKLVAATMSSTLVDADNVLSCDNSRSPLSVAQTAQQLSGLLFSEANMFTDEHFKFGQLKQSLLAESQINRLKLANYLRAKSACLVTVARQIRNYLDQQLLLQVRDNDSDDTALTLARAMIPLARALAAVSLSLDQEQQRLRPSTGSVKSETSRYGNFREGRRLLTETTETLVHSTKKYAGKAGKLAFRTKHTLAAVGYSQTVTEAVRSTALLLLDEIQQAEQRIKQLPEQVMDILESVEQYSLLMRRSRYPKTQLALNAQLSEQLINEAERWQFIGQKAREKLREFIAPLTRMAEDEGRQAFLSLLSLKPVMSGLNEHHRKSIQHLDNKIKAVVEELASLVDQLNSTVERLAEHGHQGGTELREKATAWLRAMEGFKGRVKTAMMQATGASLNSLSRCGMLARGISEWAENIKQAYLQEKSPVERKEAGSLFDRAMMATFEENREHFARKSDPGAELFLKRLALALRHASAGSTIYPLTPEEILAGCRTLPDDLRYWAEKKVVSGAISALLRGGFILAVSGVSLPLRVAIRGGRTAWRVSHGIHAINQGVRLGQGAPNQLKYDYFYREISKAGLRLILSLSPLAGYGAAASVTGWHQYNQSKEAGNNNKFFSQVIINFSEDLFWRGVWSGVCVGENAVIRAWYRKLANDVLQDFQNQPDDAELIAAEANTLFDTKSHVILSDKPEEVSFQQKLKREAIDAPQGLENIKLPGLNDHYDTLHYPLRLINIGEYEREKKKYYVFLTRKQELQEHINILSSKINQEQNILNTTEVNNDHIKGSLKYDVRNSKLSDYENNVRMQQETINSFKSEKNKFNHQMTMLDKKHENESHLFKAIHSIEQEISLHTDNPQFLRDLLNEKIGIVNKLTAGEGKSVDPNDKNLLEQEIIVYYLMQKENEIFNTKLLQNLAIPEKLSDDKMNAIIDGLKLKSGTEQASILNTREQNEERTRILNWYLNKKAGADVNYSPLPKHNFTPFEGRIYYYDTLVQKNKVISNDDIVDPFAGKTHMLVKRKYLFLNDKYWHLMGDQIKGYYIDAKQPIHIRQVNGIDDYERDVNGNYKPWEWELKHSDKEVVKYYLEHTINLDNYPSEVKGFIKKEAIRILKKQNKITQKNFAQALHAVLTTHLNENTRNKNFLLYMLAAKSEIEKEMEDSKSEYEIDSLVSVDIPASDVKKNHIVEDVIYAEIESKLNKLKEDTAIVLNDAQRAIAADCILLSIKNNTTASFLHEYYNRLSTKFRQKMEADDNLQIKKYLKNRAIADAYTVFKNGYDPKPHNPLIKKYYDFYKRMEENDSRGEYGLYDAMNKFQQYLVNDDEDDFKMVEIYYYLRKYQKPEADEINYRLDILNRYPENINSQSGLFELPEYGNDIKLTSIIDKLINMQQKHIEAIKYFEKPQNIYEILSARGNNEDEIFINTRIIAAQIADGKDILSLHNKKTGYDRYNEIKHEGDSWLLMHIESIIHTLPASVTERDLELVKSDSAVSLFDQLFNYNKRQLNRMLYQDKLSDSKDFICYDQFKARKDLDHDSKKYYAQFDKYQDHNDAEKEAIKQFTTAIGQAQLSLAELSEKTANAHVFKFIFTNGMGGKNTTAAGSVAIIQLQGEDADAIVISDFLFKKHIVRIKQNEIRKILKIINSPNGHYFTEGKNGIGDVHNTSDHHNKHNLFNSHHIFVNGKQYDYSGFHHEHLEVMKILTGMNADEINAQLSKLYGHHNVWLSKNELAAFAFAYNGSDGINDGRLNKKSVREAVKEILTHENNEMAHFLRSAMYSSTEWEKVLDSFIPFHNIIRNSLYDREYEINTEQFLVELISAILVVYPAMKGVTAGIRASTVPAILKSGLKGPALFKELSTALAKTGVDFSKVLGRTTFELIDPMPLPSHLNLNHVTVKLSTSAAHSPSSIPTYLSKTSSSPSSWKVERKELNKAIPDEKGIYKIRTEYPNPMNGSDYFIKSEDAFYQVIYDRDNNNWRLISPDPLGGWQYHTPVRLNQNKQWEINANVGLKEYGRVELFLKQAKGVNISDFAGRLRSLPNNTIVQ